MPSILPMMKTPAGTLKPAKVFIIGAGVAGLQAIATAKRLGARLLLRLDLRFVIRAGIGTAVWNSDDFVRLQPGGVLMIVVAQRNAERNATEQQSRDPMLPAPRIFLEPPAHSSSLVVVNNFLIEWTADQHHNPVAVNGVPQSRRGDIIKVSGTTADPQPDRPQTKPQQEEQFTGARGSNVVDVSGESGVHMKYLNTVAPLSAKLIEQLLHHETLAVKRRRNMGENNQLHDLVELSCAM